MFTLAYASDLTVPTDVAVPESFLVFTKYKVPRRVSKLESVRPARTLVRLSISSVIVFTASSEEKILPLLLIV